MAVFKINSIEALTSICADFPVSLVSHPEYRCDSSSKHFLSIRSAVDRDVLIFSIAIFHSPVPVFVNGNERSVSGLAVFDGVDFTVGHGDGESIFCPFNIGNEGGFFEEPVDGRYVFVQRLYLCLESSNPAVQRIDSFFESAEISAGKKRHSSEKEGSTFG